MGVSVNRRTFLHRPIQRARLKAEGSKSALGVKKKKSVYAACQVYLLQTNSDIVQMFLVQFEKFQKKLRE